MVEENGHVVLNGSGIWQKQADGSPLQFTDSMGHKFSPPLPRADFDAWRKEGLISQNLTLPEQPSPVFALTRGGLEAATKFAGRCLRKALIG